MRERVPLVFMAVSVAATLALGGAIAAIFNPRVTFLVAGAAALAATLAFGRLALRDRISLGERVQAGPEPSR